MRWYRTMISVEIPIHEETESCGVVNYGRVVCRSGCNRLRDEVYIQTASDPLLLTAVVVSTVTQIYRLISLSHETKM
jgi:hypothetical protein